MIARASKADRTDPSTGIVFDSKGELGRLHELQMLVRAGEIAELRRQVSFPLTIYRFDPIKGIVDLAPHPILIRSPGYPNGRACKITLDFSYRERQADGKWIDVLEDWKGLSTEAARLRIAVFEAIYGVRVRITGPQVMRKGGGHRK